MNPILSYIIIAVLVIVVIATIISAYNKLVMLKFNVEKAFVNIDVILKQRADEIPNLINVLKESMRYEESVLENLTRLRTDFLNSSNFNNKIRLANDMDKTMKSIFAVSENYPELKTNGNFLSLQTRVSEIENAIADRREFFNESINMYNIGIHEFPSFIMARILFYKEKSLLQISEAEKKYDGVQF
ncbi:LemA family protein [Flavobacterium oreochromis]|uniref:LemA family protein n=1 Tax=Flavobacterium oreochromis TaxID=2906078 RepID=A0ABW8P8U6_9FLAO|nr:LemA family protein [Flavobacterium oreochromis]OWP74445.1 hypothetical protein BWG23_13865 [Flavobacterium oreochromis]